MNMKILGPRPLSERYAELSDRFRSVWTFYQFLGGVHKHIGDGDLPLTYDFQGLYRQLKELTPRPGTPDERDQERAMIRLERDLAKVHDRLGEIERAFPPSLLRRFFDHLKRQDEKILAALIKFYLLSDTLGEDTFDKLDILLTRFCEAPLDDGRVLPRDSQEVNTFLDRLAVFAEVPAMTTAEDLPLIQALQQVHAELDTIPDFPTLLKSQIFDRYRAQKKRLGIALLHPPILREVMACNMAAKNRFKQLYQEEEVRILEDTNRILEIERHLEKNPDLAHEELRRQIEAFRQSRSRFDSSRKEGNVRRDDLVELRRAMNSVLVEFDSASWLGAADKSVPAAGRDGALQLAPAPRPSAAAAAASVAQPARSGVGHDGSTALFAAQPSGSAELLEVGPAQRAAVADFFSPDPLIDGELQKIIYGFELVEWNDSAEAVVRSKGLVNLRLEPWEATAYRALADGTFTSGSLDWELRRFLLAAAALRVKIDEEVVEIARLNQGNHADHLLTALDHSAQTLDRAREVSRRFKWFVDDQLFRGHTDHLEQLNRCHFRLLHSYSRLWLDHQASGGLTPL